MTRLPMFFVFSIPRSGTTWLGRYLSKCNPEWLVAHEPHKNDFHFDMHCAFRPWIATEYMDRRHERVMDYVSRKQPAANGYGEVTPRARYFSAELSRYYPHAPTVHLVRDPRKAVPSMINYGYYHPTTGRAHRRAAPDAGKWSREKRTAWAWAFGHHRIRQHVSDFVRFEDLLSDFDVMDAMAYKLGIRADRTVWEKERGKKINTSKPVNPLWDGYSEETRTEIRRMCEGEATQYGYLAD